MTKMTTQGYLFDIKEIYKILETITFSRSKTPLMQF